MNGFDADNSTCDPADRDAAFDALLHEALAPTTAQDAAPADLAQRIVARTSGQLAHAPTEQLVAAALAPAATPQLAQRIWRATGHLVGRAAVVARIGPLAIDWQQLRTVAAMVLFGIGVSITVICHGIDQEAAAITQARRDIVAVSDYAGPTDPIDQQIDHVMLQVELAQSGSSWSQSTHDISRALLELETDLQLRSAEQQDVF